MRYWSEGVWLDIEAKGEETVRSGLLAGLTSDQARELATMVHQAAEELDRRRERNDADQ
ncbi:hypothetical protein [Haloquadratum walsbyi]|uniref:hypothetical protein n=1 Tax=Haloquadratum walsbyi TaxID=293091 RepID=UPI000A8FD61D|nr:hypothetical protein [Haloquadratum walsbyi]